MEAKGEDGRERCDDGGASEWAERWLEPCCRDSFVQVMQVIQEKEQQPKFKSGTKAYKHNNIVKFALQENLKEFGWSLPPMQKQKRSKKEVVEPDLFRQY